MSKKSDKIKIAIIAIIGGLLGSWAGAEGTSKTWRRFGIPLLLSSIAFFHLQNWHCFWIISMTIPLSIGYGVISSDDEGSTLGKFWYKIVKGNQILTNVLTRGTIGALIAVSLISIPIITGHWLVYLLGGLGIVLVNALVSWQGLGTFTFKGKELLWSEFITWCGICAFAGITIFF